MVGCKHDYTPGVCPRCGKSVRPGEECGKCRRVTVEPGRCPRPSCGRRARPYELPDFFGPDEQPPEPLDDALSGVWWLLHTLARGEGGRAGWLELEAALDRLGVVEPARRDAWREACWIVEEAAAHGTEVRLLREEEERESRSRGGHDDRGLGG